MSSSNPASFEPPPLVGDFASLGGSSPCQRCGDFAPVSTHRGRWWCQACLDRRLPLETTPIGARRLVRESVPLIRPLAYWLALWVPMQMAVELAPEAWHLRYPGRLATSMLSCMVAVATDCWITTGRKLPARQSLRLAASWPVWVFVLLTSAPLALRPDESTPLWLRGTALLTTAAVGLYAHLSLPLLPLLVAREGWSGVALFRESVRRMRGHRLTLLTVYVLFVLFFTPVALALLAAHTYAPEFTGKGPLLDITTATLEAGGGLWTAIVPALIYAKLATRATATQSPTGNP